jgi:hypothetical protein
MQAWICQSKKIKGHSKGVLLLPGMVILVPRQAMHCLSLYPAAAYPGHSKGMGALEVLPNSSCSRKRPLQQCLA